MKYFGKKSLSSFLYGLLRVSWYLVLVLAVAATLFMGAVMFYASPVDTAAQGKLAICGIEAGDSDIREIRNLPLAARILIMPYFTAIAVLLLTIIKKSQLLFANFKNDILFNRDNVVIIRKIARLLIVFSLLTLDFNALLLSVVVLMLCEIFRSGAALQEEHDLTV